MYNEAYLALEAIRRSDQEALCRRDHWLKAFRAIRWIIDTDEGPALTEAGLQARDDLAVRRRA
jgi:hypothetical protein